MKISGRQWIEPSPVEVPASIRDICQGNELLAETLVRRGFFDPDKARAFLDVDFYQPTNPFELPGLEKGVRRLITAVKNREHIGIWGDFDVDGQTATALLVSSLRNLGGKVSYHIPVRATESHGINLPGLELFLKKDIDMLISCDTGIAAFDAVEFTRSRNIDFIITDHHTLPEVLPDALAVINPQRLPAGHPLSFLCGVGCAFELMKGLYQEVGQPGWFDQYLDLVSLGTVADLAYLSGDNRFLVQKGLSAIRENPRPSFQALFDTAGILPDHITEEHISFILAPRLNAIGRLSDANPVVDFLLGEAPEKIKVFAAQLEGLNARRKLLCDQVFQAAQSQIEKVSSILDDPLIILSHPEWPAGVVGIVASRLVEIYQRPVILLSVPRGEVARGSARSIEGVNITKAIAASQALLKGYGGHSMAAGLSIDIDRIPEFRRQISRTISEMLVEHPPLFKLSIDAFLVLDQLNIEMVENLEQMSPFGPGNPHFTFATRNLIVKNSATLGRSGEHRQLMVEEENGISQRVIWWQGAGLKLPEGRFDLAYQVRTSNYRGQKEIQIEWVDARIIETGIEVNNRRQSAVDFIDLRSSTDRESALGAVQFYENVIIWRESDAEPDLPGLNRFNLIHCATLVLWNSPPGQAELKSIIDSTQPARIILLNFDPPDDRLPNFLSRLAGLLKHILSNKNGRFNLNDLVGATNQRVATVKYGLEWFSTRGQISILEQTNNNFLISLGGNENPALKIEIEKTLNALLKETSSFRAYYLRADLHSIIT